MARPKSDDKRNAILDSATREVSPKNRALPELLLDLETDTIARPIACLRHCQTWCCTLWTMRSREQVPRTIMT